jgi:hypothetical protein
MMRGIASVCGVLLLASMAWAACDTVAPVSAIVFPIQGAQVARRSFVLIEASASDDVGVTRVEIHVNGEVLCAMTTAPYICQWVVPNPPRRMYQLQAKAFDARGNVGTSPVVEVSSR